VHDSAVEAGEVRRDHRFGADGGGHRFVTSGSGDRIGNADDVAELHRELDRLASVREPLELVGVEQRVGCVALEDEVELPRQVGGIPDAGAHALPGEWRHLVGGIWWAASPASITRACRQRSA